MEIEKLNAVYHNNEVKAALDAGKRIGELENFEVKEIEGVPHVVMPKGQELKSLEHLLAAPRSIRETPSFCEIDGFASYVNDFKNDNSKIFYGPGLFSAIIDYSGKEKPAWHRHIARLCLQYTDEWLAWDENNETVLSHIDFVKFLQIWLHTISDPDAADLLDSAREFSAHRNAKFDAIVPAAGGNLSVSYSEEVRGATKSGTAEMPSRLKLVLKPYLAFDKTYEVDVVINWNLSRDGELSFIYTMLRTQDVTETAVKEIREEIEKDTEIKVLA